MRRISFAFAILLLAASVSAFEFRAITLGIKQAWTGNGYVPNPGGQYDFDVTGSEGVPIDGFAQFGIRGRLIEGFITERGDLSFAPGLEFGYRRYALFESGRVVPAPTETGAVEEDGVAGPGSADVLTIRVPLAFAWEHRFDSGVFHASLSPTVVLRFPVANEVLRDSSASMAGMSDWFFGSARFIMPEIGVGYRMQVSRFLEAGITLDYGVSVVDLFDATVPAHDQMRAALGFQLSLVPPFTGLARDRNPEEAP